VSRVSTYRGLSPNFKARTIVRGREQSRIEIATITAVLEGLCNLRLKSWSVLLLEVVLFMRI
jgi:hypothetical protein